MPPTSPALEFVTELSIHVGEPVEFGEVLAGRRRVIAITGGSFDGPLLKGELLPGGADWQIIRRDGVAVLDARYMLRTHDGALIAISNGGLRHGPPEIMQKLVAGEPVPPGSYYFRTLPSFETSDPRYAWLQKHVFVGNGIRHPNEVVIQIWKVL